MDKGAIFSDDRVYRYVLWRTWDADKPAVNFIGLNPSTADETEDDPTIRRCIGYAKAWGYGGLVMTNLFAYRSTDPKALRTADDPFWSDQYSHLRARARDAGLVVAAWGAQPSYQHFRVKDVLNALDDLDLYALKLTKNGYPSHPLYLRADLTPILYRKAQS